MPRLDVQIPAPDGHSNASLHLPDGEGPHPGVLMFPDAGGLRETFRQMGDHLAGLGFVTLVPDVYYRGGDWAPFDINTVFTVPEERARLGSLMGGLISDPELVTADARAYAEFLLNRPEVAGERIGTTGYCLGGWMSLTSAVGLGETIAAAASFHGGRIAVADAPTSPHHGVDRIRATVYVAGALEDDSFTTEQATLLDNALTAAGVQHTVEFYQAHHGFAVPDNPTYDAAADTRHWAALEQLYSAQLI
jgi:carboxymethylenebutenolidase